MKYHKRGKAPMRMKILFWILMGMISTFFAEVISGSTPFAFFTPLGWLVVFPIYFFHIVLLSAIVFRYGKPTIYTLYPAGMIFGMYEAYITKVVWGSADWSQNTLSIGGIYIMPLLLVVFFFHPFISFILSLTVSEVTLTSSRDTLSYMPEFIRERLTDSRRFRKVLLLGAIFLGLIWAKPAQWTMTFLAELSSLIVIIISIYLWREKLHGNRYEISDLLPEKRGMMVLGALLIFIYILFGAYMNSRYFPGADTQILTWLIYLALFFILYRNLRMSRKEGKKRVKLPDMESRWLLTSMAVFILISSLKVATGLGVFLFIIVAFPMSFLGVYLFLKSIRKALTPIG